MYIWFGRISNLYAIWPYSLIMALYLRILSLKCILVLRRGLRRFSCVFAVLCFELVWWYFLKMIPKYLVEGWIGIGLMLIFSFQIRLKLTWTDLLVLSLILIYHFLAQIFFFFSLVTEVCLQRKKGSIKYET